MATSSAQQDVVDIGRVAVSEANGVSFLSQTVPSPSTRRFAARSASDTIHPRRNVFAPKRAVFGAKKS